MNRIHEIFLQNPITSAGIDGALESILHDTADCLLLDTGDHQFRSIADLKYLREALEAHAERLSCYSKIAFLHPEGYSNVSTDPAKYQYFSHRNAAVAWLTAT